jgi:hypothetical protein
MTSLGFEPQWYITQPVVFTMPLEHLLVVLQAYRNLLTITFFL